MDQDATWYGRRPRPRPHCFRRGPSSSRKGTAAPLFPAHMSIVGCGHGRPSQLLLSSCPQMNRLKCFTYQRDLVFTIEQICRTLCCLSRRDVRLSLIFGRPFVKRFALCYQTVVYLSCLVCLMGPSYLQKKAHPPLRNFWPKSIVAKRPDASRRHLV